MTQATPLDGLDRVVGASTRLRAALERVLVGQRDVIDALIATALAGGHALLEGVPGVGKTMLARNFAKAANLDYARIQFTPDLMPADITGTQIFENQNGALTRRFETGPLFTQVLLADEINRATPKTQSALLEAMQERGVTVAGQTHALPQPFMVVATQNPLEMEGTYPLPEAQLDRFVARIVVTRPTPEVLKRILLNPSQDLAQTALEANQWPLLQRIAASVPVSEPLLERTVALVDATHQNPSVRYGLSPRGAQALLGLARAFALLAERPFVGADDIRRAAPLAMHHRLILTLEAELEGQDASAIIAKILETWK